MHMQAVYHGYPDVRKAMSSSWLSVSSMNLVSPNTRLVAQTVNSTNTNFKSMFSWKTKGYYYTSESVNTKPAGTPWAEYSHADTKHTTL